MGAAAEIPTRSLMCIYSVLGWDGEGRDGGALKDWLYLRAVPARAADFLLKENTELNSELSPGLQVGGLVYKTLQVCTSIPRGLHGGEKWGQRASSVGPWAPSNIKLSLA